MRPFFHDSLDKLIILAVLVAVMVIAFLVRNEHDAFLYFSGAGTTAMGGLLGLLKGATTTKQENTITNSDVTQQGPK